MYTDELIYSHIVDIVSSFWMVSTLLSQIATLVRCDVDECFWSIYISIGFNQQRCVYILCIVIAWKW